MARRFLVLVTLGVLFASQAQAQTLGEIAKKAEAAKAARAAKDGKDAKDAPKKLTDKDLKADPTAPADPPQKPSDAASVKADDEAVKVDNVGAPARDETYWKNRKRGLDMQLAADVTAQQAAASRLAQYEIEVEQSRRDIDGIPMVDRLLKTKMLEARDETSRLKVNVDTDRIALNAFEEEARKAGVPPGWLRY